MPEPIGFAAANGRVLPYEDRAPLVSQIRASTQQPLLAWLTTDLIWRNDLLKVWSQRQDIRHRMLEWNPDIGGAYDQLIYPVIASAPRVQPAHGDERPEAEDQAGLITTDLRTGSGYRSTVAHLCRGPWYGNVVLELMGRFGLGDPSQGEPVVPKALRVPYEHVRYDAVDGVARILTDADLVRGVRVDAPADRWRYIVAAWGSPEGINPYGLGLAERVYWSWHFLTFGRKYWMTALERFGMPTLDVALTAAEWATHRDTWLQIIKDYQATGGIVRPAEAGTVALLNEQSRSFPGYEKLDETFRAAIQRAILGQTLTSEQGPRGSQALGRVHQDVLTDRQWMLVMWVQDTLTETLVRWLSEYRFGADHGFRLTIEFEDQADAAQQEVRLRAAREGGIPLLKREVYEILGAEQPAADAAPEDVHVWPAVASPFDGPGSLGMARSSVLLGDRAATDPATPPGADATLGASPLAMGGEAPKAMTDGLNGAQVTSLLEITAQVSRGEITKETAVQLMMAAFPFFGEARIRAILEDIVEGEKAKLAASEQEKAALVAALGRIESIAAARGAAQ